MNKMFKMKSQINKTGETPEWALLQDSVAINVDLEPARDDGKPLVRDIVEIREAYHAMRDQVWYIEHQKWLARIASGEEPLSDEQKPVLENAKKQARLIEKTYGKKNLNGPDDCPVCVGSIIGRLAALSFVLGAEWQGGDDGGTLLDFISG